MAEGKSPDKQDPIAARLNLLIWLQLDQKFPSPTEKISKLAEFGLGAKDIGAITGKPSNYVNAVLSSLRKTKSKGKSK